MKTLGQLQFYLVLTLWMLLVDNLSAVPVNIICTYYTYAPRYFRPTYTCFIRKNPAFGGQQVSIACVHGRHDPHKSTADVRGVFMSRDKLIKLPQNFDHSFPHLESMILWDVKLPQITQSDLKNLKNLRYLDLHDNKITVIEEYLFEFNPQLEYINLSLNQISHVSPRVFSKLENLNVLLIDGNKCTASGDLLNEFYRNGTRKLIGKIEMGICVDAEGYRGYVGEKIGVLEGKVMDLKEKIEGLKREGSGN